VWPLGAATEQVIEMSLASNRTKFKPATRSAPCAVCEGADGCSSADDGLLFCRRREGQQPGFVYLGQAQGDPQWALYRREGDPHLQSNGNYERRRYAGRSPNGFSPKDSRLEALASRYADNLTPELRRELAELLGLPESALAALCIGYQEQGPHVDDNHRPMGACWVLPETDANGTIVGLTCRYRDGTKRACPGHQRGIIVPRNWEQNDGPILLPEGPSDTLALTALGLAAVGRPSNTGGVEHLVELLRNIPAERPIVVVGEFDPKPDGQWPGRDGAVRVATALAEKLGRPVLWTLPPSGVKDIRAWAVSSQNLDTTCSDLWDVAGQKLLAELLRKPHKVEPPRVDARFTWEPIGSATLARTDYRPTWLVRRLLVRNQPGIVGGPRKAMKTSILVDMAVSLASGTPLLGEFQVYCPVRVAMLSGESGPFTLQETATRICQARELDLEALHESLLWQFRLPQLAKADQLTALQAGLRDCGIDVLIFDPLYLALLAGQGPNGARPENLFDMGPLLLGITQACLDVGTTPLLIHHAKKGSNSVLEPLDLDDLAFAGVAEFARQWFLVSRREKYAPGTGQHKLWLNVGGSVGHGGLWSVDVDEGIISDDFSGRKWDVKVSTATEAITQANDQQRQARNSKIDAQDRQDDADLLAALDLFDPQHQGTGYNRVQTQARLSDARMQRSVNRLLRDAIIREMKVTTTIGSGAERQVRGLVRAVAETIS
jgi:hypothetical protein